MALVVTTLARVLAAALSVLPVTATATPAPLTLFADSTTILRPRFSVEIVGRGPDIVLIPGLASSRETWRATAERLRARYRLHLIQIAGFAGEPPRANASGAFFDPVLAELDAYCASLGRPIVMGHSLGGTLGLALAQRHPEHLSKLLIVELASVLRRPDGRSGSDHRNRRADGRPNAKRQNRNARADDARHDGTNGYRTSRRRPRRRLVVASSPAVVGMAMGDDMTADLRPGLAAMKTPVTVLYETVLDGPITTGYAAMPHKTLIAVPDAKHFIMYDQPVRFAAEVDAFLAR